MVKSNHVLMYILIIGVFGILTTEMGVIGILPQIADYFHVSVSKAGLLVSLFALAVAIAGPTMPLLFSGINRKTVMLLVLGIFVVCNIISIFAPTFTVALVARIIPGFFHPIYCSLALTVAATSVSSEEAPKAVSKVMLGVTAGMVLGVPITNYIANGTSVEMAMVFIAIVNALAFLGTWIFIPSMPVKEKLAYGAQLSILKRGITWLAIAAVILMASATASVNSYIAEYLGSITHISGKTLSIVLFIYGLASLVGNVVGGRLLSKNTRKTVILFPVVLGIVYLLSFWTGTSTGPMILTVILWGVCYAISNLIGQYWITSAAPEAPDFSNGLFLSCGNLGITLGTAVGGLFISGIGTQYIVLGGVLFLVLSLLSILLRIRLFDPVKKQHVS
ncbi:MULTISPECIES: MFS transporter [unclassified Paenibacillus]|uniref:MFS transporter n=1 Tax=unclassified Paenibacillus TaxID=185978 RepID=UPI0009A88012|nr:MULTISPECIES: MFS transporter [unclassified Paenibacillus]SLK10257.1 Predicted arabinose efflux permease, MFS family [Paenibacillus sp. RU5A]SOC71956.1 Predicted arabinose efflux permease, MFS family [Paenibacillus sp. RU26A]SOC74311.1 Predicted arabinose efflux permease, MFS family [Paenibacillus sp. RU5M]